MRPHQATRFISEMREHAGKVADDFNLDPDEIQIEITLRVQTEEYVTLEIPRFETEK